MPMYKKMAADLLREGARFFESVAEQNPQIRDAMNENASIYKQTADLLMDDPTQMAGEKPINEIANDLLIEAGKFFISVANQNEAIAQPMLDNAEVYRQMGEVIMKEPTGFIPD